MLDIAEIKILLFGIPSFFLVFLFLSLNLGIKILFFSTLLFFLILFSLCTYWAREWHPEREFIIGFLVSIFHTFLFLLAGVFGLILALITLKIFPHVLIYLKEIFYF